VVEAETDDIELICSAKRCRAAAVHELRWNNPGLHVPGRRKTWLACDEHRESLSTFLSARGFLREVRPLGGAGTDTVEGTRTGADGTGAMTA
jgi:hypothetical protein